MLPTAALSALMRTCRHLSEAALLPLCARSFRRLNTEIRVASFHRFLRINAGPLSRTSFIKALWLEVPFELCDSDQGSNEYLAILRHCQQVRRLRLSSWYRDISPTLLFHVITTSLMALEELDLFVRPSVSEKDLRNLTRLPLRKLRITGNLFSVRNLLSVIHPLARTLVELSDISFDVLQVPQGASFPGVRVLGIYYHHSDSFVKTLATMFPGVTHLNISGTVVLPQALGGGLRERNRQLWQKGFPKAWQSLQAVYARNIGGLYAIGLARRVAYLSVPFDRLHILNAEKTLKLSAVLADLCPSALELRINLISFHVVNVLDESFQALLQSSPRIILRLEGLGSDKYDRGSTTLFLVRFP